MEEYIPLYSGITNKALYKGFKYASLKYYSIFYV
jgi:hypothetical protein